MNPGARLVRPWCVSGALSMHPFLEPSHIHFQLSGSMNDKFKTILDNLPPKRQRSQLEPYSHLIDELRRRGRTYREIAHILAEKCELIVASSTVVRFMATRSRAKRKYAKLPKTINMPLKKNYTEPAVKEQASRNRASVIQDDKIWKRIEMLKHRPAQSIRPPKQFEYDPDRPLHLLPKHGKNKSG
jgi:hypothetical protein